ncbi:hypothetical protein BKA69DRAFT_1028066, partial [Paraphysoderma sedebokerense]
QAKNYYRYGTYKDCKPFWEDVKFCAWLKTKSESDAKNLIRQRNQEKKIKETQKPSSLDIWQLRDTVCSTFFFFIFIIN